MKEEQIKKITEIVDELVAEKLEEKLAQAIDDLRVRLSENGAAKTAPRATKPLKNGRRTKRKAGPSCASLLREYAKTHKKFTRRDFGKYAAQKLGSRGKSTNVSVCLGAAMKSGTIKLVGTKTLSDGVQTRVYRAA